MDCNKRDLSDEKKEILKQFRSRLRDILTPDHTDAILLKFLRAKNFNLEKTELHFREIQWNRITYEVDTICDTYTLPEVIKYRGDTFLGYAKDGSLIRYIVANIDFYGFIQSLSMYEIGMYFLHLMEDDLRAMKEKNKKTGRENNEVTYIIDVEEYSLWQFTHKCVIEVGIECLRLMQEHYPEIWGNVLFVNVPFLYGKVFNIFNSIMGDNLVRKMKFVSKAGTGELLRQYVDEDVLPAFLGGERVDSQGDIYCREFINRPVRIPEKYFLRNCIHFIDETDPGVRVVIIGARSVYNVTLIVKQKDTRFKIELRTENGSLTVSMLYRDFGQDPENPDLPESDEYLDPHDDCSNVIKVGTRIRVHSHISPNDGMAFASKPGIYILQCDNTDSWFTSRKLFYRATIYLPEDQR